jgi:hypothetical protein
LCATAGTLGDAGAGVAGLGVVGVALGEISCASVTIDDD